mmetsp:Transcript_127324/g.271456  ORF Transcript_127324/g.271456 Transcript_127324/m.271456 type:complete len:220 (+) Transcript_127324:342-1001(+)
MAMANLGSTRSPASVHPFHCVGKRKARSCKARDPVRNCAHAQILAERVAEMAAVSREDIVVAFSPTPLLKPMQNRTNIVVAQHHFAHRQGLGEHMFLAKLRLAAEDPCGFKAPLLAIDLHAAVEGARAQNTENLVHRDHFARCPQVVNVERHGHRHRPRRCQARHDSVDAVLRYTAAPRTRGLRTHSPKRAPATDQPAAERARSAALRPAVPASSWAHA